MHENSRVSQSGFEATSKPRERTRHQPLRRFTGSFRGAAAGDVGPLGVAKNAFPAMGDEGWAEALSRSGDTLVAGGARGIVATTWSNAPKPEWIALSEL